MNSRGHGRSGQDTKGASPFLPFSLRKASPFLTDSQFNFNEILIYQDRIVINGETFDPKRIEIKYEHRRYLTHGVVLCADKCICVFIHESIFGRLTGENPATVVDVLQKIKQGIHIDGPVEQKFERRLFGYVVLAVLMLEVLLFYGLARWR
jgi:hypothetical protein